MRGLAGRRIGALVSLSLVVAISVATGASASFATPPTDTSYAEATTRPTAPIDLTRPVRGADAVRALSGQMDEFGGLNAMTGDELADLLRTDRTAWLDTGGMVFFKDQAAQAPAVDPLSALAPLDQTLLLHSKPGSQHTIFLDFDGGAASGTGWHVNYPSVPELQPAWDPSGNGTDFDTRELTRIQTIWRSVAEDYAPFDVDVTTTDPGAAAINRDSTTDPVFGAHVLITPSTEAQQAICPSGCGGVAYNGVLDAVRGPGGDGYGFMQPVWVFPHMLGNSAKNIGEAASHEVGHSLGLSHDGSATSPYDRGHGAWASIMGVGYDRPLTQWSKGDYAGADNTEDDLAIIGAVMGVRPDEAGSTVADAAPLPTGAAFIGNRDDIDTFSLGTCAGAVTLSADPAISAADLDLKVTLLDASGNTVAVADPASAMSSATVAVGTAASVSQDVGPGTYFAAVDGVGNGTWVSGYDDYASLGAYTLSVAGCGDGAQRDVVTPPTPAPEALTPMSTQMQWTAAPSGSTAAAPAAVSASTTKVVAPRKAKRGSRPVLRISVLRGTKAASGKVTIVVGRKITTLTLRAGTTALKLPRVREGRLTITVRYLGDASTAPSSITRRITVKPA